MSILFLKILLDHSISPSPKGWIACSLKAPSNVAMSPGSCLSPPATLPFSNTALRVILQTYLVVSFLCAFAYLLDFLRLKYPFPGALLLCLPLINSNSCLMNELGCYLFLQKLSWNPLVGWRAAVAPCIHLYHNMYHVLLTLTFYVLVLPIVLA